MYGGAQVLNGNRDGEMGGAAPGRCGFIRLRRLKNISKYVSNAVTDERSPSMIFFVYISDVTSPETPF
jgi:hypothetical protein